MYTICSTRVPTKFSRYGKSGRQGHPDHATLIRADFYETVTSFCPQEIATVYKFKTPFSGSNARARGVTPEPGE